MATHVGKYSSPIRTMLNPLANAIQWAIFSLILELLAQRFSRWWFQIFLIHTPKIGEMI